MGKGKVVKSLGEADFVLAADQEEVKMPEGGHASILLFADFLCMIPAYRWSCGSAIP